MNQTVRVLHSQIDRNCAELTHRLSLTIDRWRASQPDRKCFFLSHANLTPLPPINEVFLMTKLMSLELSGKPGGQHKHLLKEEDFSGTLRWDVHMQNESDWIIKRSYENNRWKQCSVKSVENIFI